MNQEGTDHGRIRQVTFRKTKIVATIHISNALGTINPVNMIDQAHTYGAAVLIDGAQAVPI
jgi:cysteine desulfurase/selenocysteine lyase